jgi:hypothetical protein
MHRKIILPAALLAVVAGCGAPPEEAQPPEQKSFAVPLNGGTTADDVIP